MFFVIKTKVDVFWTQCINCSSLNRLASFFSSSVCQYHSYFVTHRRLELTFWFILLASVVGTVILLSTLIIMSVHHSSASVDRLRIYRFCKSFPTQTISTFRTAFIGSWASQNRGVHLFKLVLSSLIFSFIPQLTRSRSSLYRQSLNAC